MWEIRTEIERENAESEKCNVAAERGKYYVAAEEERCPELLLVGHRLVVKHR